MKFKSARRFVRCTAMLLIAIASTVAVAATNPVPLIEQPLLPQNAVPGGAGFTVTVKGAGFVNGAVLNWNGSARPTSFVSSTKLTASVTAADVANAGTATVTVTNPVPGGGSSNPVFFQVTDPVVSIQTAATWKSATLLDAGMVTADFNQDGKPDVAVINCGTDLLCEHDVNSIDVYLGDGHGALTTGPSTVIPNSSLIPKLSLTGDFNGDGKIDVAVGTFYCVDIFLGDGTGAFTLASTFGSQAELPVILSLGAGDFNRDGNLDLLVGTNSDQAVHFAAGDGTGHFTLSGKTAGFAAGLVVGDFNNDSILDFAISNSDITLFLGDGTGHFTGSTAATSTFSQGLAAGDFNGDGNLDIAGGDVYSNQLHILLGNGAGGFTASTVPAAANSAAIVTADLNGDGKLDLAVVPSSAFSGENFYLGNGNGGFTAGGFGTAFPQPNYLAVADFNGDGLLDVATLSTSGPLAIDTQSLVTPVTLTFVTQPLFTTSMSQLVTLTNTSTASLNLSSVVVTGDFVQTNTCGTSLASGATCQINVSFRPTGRGNRTGLLTITDDASSSPQTVALNGIGTAFTLSPNVLSFGGVKIGDTRVQTATIANVGKSNLHIISVVPDGDLTYYSIGTDCKKTIAPSASCTVTIRYSPQMLIVDRATLTFNEDGGDGSQVLTFSGNGRN